MLGSRCDARVAKKSLNKPNINSCFDQQGLFPLFPLRFDPTHSGESRKRCRARLLRDNRGRLRSATCTAFRYQRKVGGGVPTRSAPEELNPAIVEAAFDVMAMTAGLLAAGIPLLPPEQFLSRICGTF